MSEAKEGILALNDSANAHATAFKVNDGVISLFDPDMGEFNI
ncbi:hypothetical protein [Paracidovorax anthurii]|uniref:Uncharacterized protein n=1 Tax=Paracidovorax anthurii TaxID=78229 RepID=A0A328Y7U8_9BURK|nr:hypothetical protein [Paracidovorax anthurii]RAR70161.1 hypothetical protein AX018_11231 [Paracidovorax anthurii]